VLCVLFLFLENDQSEKCVYKQLTHLRTRNVMFMAGCKVYICFQGHRWYNKHHDDWVAGASRLAHGHGQCLRSGHCKTWRKLAFITYLFCHTVRRSVVQYYASVDRIDLSVIGRQPIVVAPLYECMKISRGGDEGLLFPGFGHVDHVLPRKSCGVFGRVFLHHITRQHGRCDRRKSECHKTGHQRFGFVSHIPADLRKPFQEQIVAPARKGPGDVQQVFVSPLCQSHQPTLSYIGDVLGHCCCCRFVRMPDRDRCIRLPSNLAWVL